MPLLFALLDEEITVTPAKTVVTLADLWFYGLFFVILAGAIFFVAILLGKNAPHSIGSMRSKTHPHPAAATGGRFSGPAIHGRW